MDFCPGGGAPLRQIVENVVSFVRTHPELKDKASTDIVRWGLDDAFPCPTARQRVVVGRFERSDQRSARPFRPRGFRDNVGIYSRCKSGSS